MGTAELCFLSRIQGCNVWEIAWLVVSVLQDPPTMSVYFAGELKEDFGMGGSSGSIRFQEVPGSHLQAGHSLKHWAAFGILYWVLLNFKMII